MVQKTMGGNPNRKKTLLVRTSLEDELIGFQFYQMYPSEHEEEILTLVEVSQSFMD